MSQVTSALVERKSNRFALLDPTKISQGKSHAKIAQLDHTAIIPIILLLLL